MAQVPVIAYVRVSMAREDMISPEIQQSAIGTWAQANSRRVARTIEDLDATGRHFRRKVATAIDAIAAGEAAQIAVYRFDRWGRNALESLANIRRVEVAGGSVVSVTEPFDAETAIGRYTRTNAFALAEMQSDIIGENWRAAHVARISRGLPAAGRPRFGYMRLGRVPDAVRAGVYRRDVNDPCGERYEPDPVTGPILREMYERYVAGEGSRTLAHELNGRGILTLKGGTWTHRTLLQVMETGFAAGLLRVHDSANCKCDGDVASCVNVLWLPGAQIPLISMETWQAFCARKTSRQRGSPGRQEKILYPLSGLLFCGTCGHVLTSTYNYGIRGYGYMCSRKARDECATGVFVRRTVAEAAVLERLGEWAADIDAAAREAHAQHRPRPAVHRDRLRAEETQIRNGLSDLLVRRALDQNMPEEVYEDARKKLLLRLETVQARLATDTAAPKPDAASAHPVALGLMESWDRLAAGTRRDILAKMVTRIEVHNTGFRKPPRIRIVTVWEEL